MWVGRGLVLESMKDSNKFCNTDLTNMQHVGTSGVFNLIGSMRYQVPRNKYSKAASIFPARSQTSLCNT